MELQEQQLIETLATSNIHLRRAYDEHTRLNEMVDQLASKPHLDDQDSMHRRELQKRKLRAKEKIMRILAEHDGA